MATLNSKIMICKGINVDNEYVNVLSYSESDMVSLCESKAVATANDYQFIREHNSIYTNFTYGQCLQCNYIAFQNPDYSNKWFFAFITEVIYQGEENTEIKFKVDSWSTWYDYWTKKTCYIIREHTNNDTIGSNTISENLDVGEVIAEDEGILNPELSDSWVAISSAWTPKDGSTSNEGSQYDGITVYNKQVFANKLHLIHITNINDFYNVLYFILRTNVDGHIGDLKNIFYIPRSFN